MLDKQGRLAIGKELIERSKSFKLGGKTDVYFDPEKKYILLTTEEISSLFFINSTSIDTKGRIYIPKIIRKNFPMASYVPAEKDGNIYVIIMDYCKEPE